MPQENTLIGVCVIDKNTFAAVGINGTVIRTNDGGITWSVQHEVENITTNLQSVSFYDEMMGMAVGDDGKIIRTEDGGTNWSLSESGTSEFLFDVEWVSSNIAIAVGGSVILRTSDSGLNWVTQLDTAVGLIAFSCSGNTGTAVAVNGSILRTTDAGIIWQNQVSGTYDILSGVFQVDPETCIVVGHNEASETATILRTTDGGTNWIDVSPLISLRLFDVSFSSSLNGVAVGGGNAAPLSILQTSDGGVTWIPRSSDTYRFLVGVSMDTSGTGITVGEYGSILQTRNGGERWESVTKVTTLDLYAVAATSPNRATIVGSKGTILTTQDGGKTWVPRPTGIGDEALLGLSFSDEMTGIVAGANGTILRTTNAGETWFGQASGTNLSLHGVSATDQNTATVVGQSGTILRTSDGGNTWVPQTSGVSVYLNSVFFVDGNVGTAVGGLGTVLRTTDGGGTWSVQTIPGQPLSLWSVFFANRDTGWTVGNGIFKTTDGGNTWIQNLNVTGLLGITFTSELNGFAIGRNILCTTDGGANWSSVSISVEHFLHSISFVDQNNGLVVGTGGLIMKTTNGGTVGVEDLNELGFSRNIFLLGPNYPNPFNPETTISFSIPNSAHVVLKVFDVLGREVVSLVDGFEQAGAHSVRFDGSQLTSGVYFYRLVADQFTATKKLLLLR